jgi:pectinesterase
VSIPSDTTYTVRSTYVKLLKEYPTIKPVMSSLPKGVRQYDNVVYLTIKGTSFGDRKLHADVFVPEKKGAYPALLLVHGGGWRSGDKSMNTPMAHALAARGFVVVSVEYRLSLEAKYPAAVHDLKAAIRWMRAHAREYHIDPDRIAIGGASAGGQLASLIGTTYGQQAFEGQLGYNNYSSQVQAVVDMDGLLDFTAPESLALTRNDYSADVFWLEGYCDTIPDKWRQASALHWVGQASPPFLFINSSQTRFHAGCEEMAERLNALGVYNEVHKLEGSPHSYWLFHPWFDPTVNYMEVFLNKVFAEKQRTRQ